MIFVSNILRRVAGGLAASVFQQFATLFIQLATVPIFLLIWGSKLFGEWLILASVPAYLSLADFGFGTAAAHVMAMRIAQNNRTGAQSAFSAALGIGLASSIVIWLAAVVISASVPFTKLLRLSVMTDTEAKFVFIVLVTGTLASMLRAVLYAGLFANRFYAIGICILSVSRIVEFLAMAVLARFGTVPTAVGSLVTILLSCLIFIGALSRLTPWLRLNPVATTLKEAHDLAGPSLAFLWFPAGNALSMQGMVFVIGLTLGPLAVVTYTTLRTLTRALTLPLRSLNDSLRAEFSHAAGLADQPLLRTLHRNSACFALWGNCSIAILLAILGKPILHLWTAGRVEWSWSLFTPLLVAAFIQGLAYSSLMVIYASNAHKVVAPAYACISAVAVFASYFVAPLGLNAVAWVVSGLELVALAVVVHQALPITGDSLTAFVKTITHPPVKDGLTLLRRAFNIYDKDT